MPRRPGWLATAVAVCAAVSLTAVPSAGAAETARQRLVSAYSPVTMVREQSEQPPCDTTEEQFRPTTVDTVLGNPRVKLVRSDLLGGEEVVTRAPSAARIAGLRDTYYLDLPGDPLNAECTYAEDFYALERANRAPAITYAHLAREEGREGLVVQYWFFYYFNQFNDLHEGDWEGMQVAFGSASTPAEALAQGPDEIALFQHGGGERADWDDERVQKEETHPVVYAAAGSHATFYDDAIYIENGQNGSGLGCDNTSEPLSRVVPQPVLVPDSPRVGGPHQWLTYLGHWGQQEKGFNNGPQGPITKSQWTEPFTWMEGVREASPRLPGGTLLGPAPAKEFCGAVAAVSDLINLEARSRFAAALAVVGLLLLILVPALLTRWRPVSLEPLRQRRRVGQLLRAARRLYGRYWRALVPIGLTAIPIVGSTGLLWGNGFTTSIGGLHLELSGTLAEIGRPIGYALVGGAVIALLRQAEAGAPTGFLDSYRAMFERFWRLVGAQLAASLLVVLMALTVIGLPFAVWKFVDWQFVQQEILFRDSSIRDAFRRSTRLVRGRWWHTVRVAGVLWLIGAVAGPILGFALLFTALPPLASNIVGSVVFALMVPYVAIGRTLLYFDLEVLAEQEGEEEPP